MAANIDAALQQEIRDGVPEINVEIEFSPAPPTAQLEALGLKSQGNLAWGLLSRDKIEAIAALPQVVAMRLSSRPAEPKSVPAGQRIGPALALKMQADPQDAYNVLVEFRRPPEPPPEIQGLSIEGKSGNGRLSRQQIETLAKHADVLRIDLYPQMKPL